MPASPDDPKTLPAFGPADATPAGPAPGELMNRGPVPDVMTESGVPVLPPFGPPDEHNAGPVTGPLTGFVRVVNAEELLSGDPIGLGRSDFERMAAAIPVDDVVGQEPVGIRPNMRTDG